MPATLRRRVFNQLHSITHPGVRATRRLIAARFVWQAMAADLAVWCRDCVACNRAKITRQMQAPVQQMEVPRRRFSHVHVDLVGPLPVSKEGFTHLFTVVDRSTRWPEAIPLRATSTGDCVEALISGWVARFGVPEPSLQIGESSSLQVCGLASARDLGFLTIPQQLTILRAMGWWNDSTDNLRMPSGHACRGRTGCPSCLGSCWG